MPNEDSSRDILQKIVTFAQKICQFKKTNEPQKNRLEVGFLGFFFGFFWAGFFYCQP
jgi:hypothetical protein